MEKKSQNRIESLMGLRFLFALGIFIHHFDVFSDMNLPDFNSFNKFFFEGFIGVNFFFVLSGFIISYSYMEKLKGQIITPGEFIYKRIARVWPTHLLTFLLAAISYSSITSIFSKSGIVNLLMLQSYLPVNGYIFTFNGVSWCLSTEMFFYISFCFIVLLPDKYIKATFTMLLGVMAIFFFIGVDYIPNPTWFLYINPVFRLLDFLSGILIYKLYKRTDIAKIQIKKATLLETGSLMLLVIMIYLGMKNNISLYLRWDLYYLIPVSLLVYIFSINKGLISKVIGNKIFLRLGECSFAFYMIHQIVLGNIKRIFYSEITSMPSLFRYGAIGLIVTIILSLVLTYFYELPMNKLMINLRNKICKNLTMKQEQKNG